MMERDVTDSFVSMRTYMETLVNELGKRTDAQFAASDKAVAVGLATAEKAVAAALVSADKLTAAALVSAKEALVEAQAQFTIYRSASNEWRGTLDDLISKLMLRPEIEALIVGVNKESQSLSGRITILEAAGKKTEGMSEAKILEISKTRWNFSQVVLIAVVLVGWAVTAFLYFTRLATQSK
jgi:hypothetical protein